nr:hypothetical protein [Legionella sainthelensi]
MDFTTPPLSEQKQDLVNQATFIIANPDDEEIEAKVRKLFTDYLELMPGMKLENEENQEQRYRVYARSIPVLKKGYVQDAVSDWDQPLYKSSNTALLDKEASKFLALERGKHIGGGKAVMLHDQSSPTLIESPNAVLYKMMKAERKNDYKEVYKIGKAYLDKNPQTAFDDISSVSFIERIEKMTKAHAPKSARKPMWAILADIGGFKPGTVAAPIFRVAEQLETLSKTNPKQAIKSGEEYLAWKGHKKDTEYVRRIQSFVDKLKSEHSFKSIKGDLHKFKEDQNPKQKDSQYKV